MANRCIGLSKWNDGGQRVIFLLECVATTLGLSSVVFASWSGADYALSLLPFGYLVFLLSLGPDNIVKWAPGITVLNLVLFLRYVFLPFVMSVTGETSVYILNKSNLCFGVPLMLYELFGVAIVLKVTSNRSRLLLRKAKQMSRPALRYGWLVVAVAVVILSLLAFRYRYLVSGFSLITEGAVEGYSQDDTASGLVIALWDSLLGWLFVFILNNIKKSKIKINSALCLSIVATYIFLIFVYIGQVTISRWHVVIAFVASITCLLFLYPSYKGRILASVTIPVLVLVITASAFKNSTYSWSGIGYSQAFAEIFDVSIFDIYLAGPSTISDGVTMYQKGVCDISSFLIDLVQNLPYINDYVDKTISTVYNFKQIWGRGDLIMPLVGQSMIYFGWPFAPLMSMVSVYFLRVFDRMVFSGQTLAHIFISAFSGAWLGVATVLNLTVTMSWFGLRIAPFYLLIFLTELAGEQSHESEGIICDVQSNSIVSAKDK